MFLNWAHCLRVISSDKSKNAGKQGRERHKSILSSNLYVPFLRPLLHYTGTSLDLPQVYFVICNKSACLDRCVTDISRSFTLLMLNWNTFAPSVCGIILFWSIVNALESKQRGSGSKAHGRLASVG